MTYVFNSLFISDNNKHFPQFKNDWLKSFLTISAILQLIKLYYGTNIFKEFF